jgi:hypothetical protein
LQIRIRIQEGKNEQKNLKEILNFHVFKYCMLSLKIEGFSCTLGVVYGGLGIRKLKILLKKIEIHFPAINFFLILGHNTWIRIRNPEPRAGSGIRIRK